MGQLMNKRGAPTTLGLGLAFGVLLLLAIILEPRLIPGEGREYVDVAAKIVEHHTLIENIGIGEKIRSCRFVARTNDETEVMLSPETVGLSLNDYPLTECATLEEGGTIIIKKMVSSKEVKYAWRGRNLAIVP